MKSGMRKTGYFGKVVSFEMKRQWRFARFQEFSTRDLAPLFLVPSSKTVFCNHYYESPSMFSIHILVCERGCVFRSSHCIARTLKKTMRSTVRSTDACLLGYHKAHFSGSDVAALLL